MTSFDLREQMLTDATAELKTFVTKYNTIKELVEVTTAANKFISETTKKKKGEKTRQGKRTPPPKTKNPAGGNGGAGKKGQPQAQESKYKENRKMQEETKKKLNVLTGMQTHKLYAWIGGMKRGNHPIAQRTTRMPISIARRQPMTSASL